MSGVPIVLPGVLDAIHEHVNSAWARKVGGILLGRPVDDLVRVEGAVPARQTEEYAGEIAFPPPVWEDAYSALDRHPGARIVGWYHSHPGSGISMSEYDRRLHAALFGEPTNVALVLDPVADKMAWFGWKIANLSSLDTAGSDQPMPPALVASRPPSRARRAAAAGLVVLELAGAASGGYLLGQYRAHGMDQVRTLTRRLEAQQSLIERLDAALRQARANLAQDAERLRQLQAELDAAKKALQEARQKLREARKNRPATIVLHYRVQPGDSLWNLARTFYGDPLAWTKILDANHGRIPDPNQLDVGQVLDIPLSR
jgi:proteasome lid subunit RPN8/RPN11